MAQGDPRRQGEGGVTPQSIIFGLSSPLARGRQLYELIERARSERGSNPQKLARVAAGDGCDGRGVEAVHGRDVADGIVVGHVKGIIRSHDDVVGAVEAHQLGELVGREHDGVEIDFLEVTGRRVRQIAVRIRARAPSMRPQ